MGFEKNNLKTKDKKLDWAAEKLSDALSLVIMLENDMEIQKSDCVHTRILKMVHKNLIDIQENLSEYTGQEKE